MFDNGSMGVVVAADTETVRALIAALGSLSPAVDDADRIERVRLFEELKSVAAAAQAIETRDFARSQRAEQATAGVPTRQQGRGVAGQIALARRISPWAAQRYLGWAAILTSELPHTFGALAAGRITEWRATLVARETIWLSREDRAQVDTDLAPHLENWGDRRVEAEARKAAYRLDPHGALERSNNATKDRRVTLRPAPETMCRLTALLPVGPGVAAYQALCRAADTTTAGGDERGRGQIMADTLVERVTGQAAAASVPVEIELVMTDRTLLGDAHPDRTGADGDGSDDARDEPAELIGYGPIPVGLARQLALDTQGQKWLRRLFLQPSTGRLAAMDSTRRYFTTSERRFIRLRDHACRTPWCEAPIRHTDHIRAHADGGDTRTSNGEGTCEACNYSKQTAGWISAPQPDGSIVTTTPTGHRYRSDEPDPPGHGPPETKSDDRLSALSARGRLAA